MDQDVEEQGIWQKFVAEARWLSRVLLAAAERFYWDNGLTNAASLAYTFLLSLVPFATLCFGILSSFAVSRGYASELQNFVLHNMVPDEAVATALVETLQEVSNRVSELSVPVLLFFVFTSILLINSIENALNGTWQVFRPRSLVHRFGIFCTIVLMAPLMLISIYFFVEVFRTNMLIDSSFWAMMNYLWPFFVLFLGFLALNYFIPKAPVKLSAAAFGAFVTALLFICAYLGFAVYLRHASYSALYGAISAIPIFLVWLYLGWTVVLLGVEITFQAQYLPKTGKVWARSVYSPGDGQFLLGIQSLVLVAQAFKKAETLPGEVGIAERLGCSSVVLRPALDVLEKNGMITISSNREASVTFARSPSTISVLEVYSAYYAGDRFFHFEEQLSTVFATFDSEAARAKLTVCDLAGGS